MGGGTLRDSRRAVLLEQKNYGKGSIHITTAEWLTPTKTHLDGVGLEPDIPMSPDANGRDVEIGKRSAR